MIPSSRLLRPPNLRHGSIWFLLLTVLVMAAMLLPAPSTLQAQPKEPDPAKPAGRAVEPAVQPSSSVEATALAIAYHALRAAGNDKPAAADIGKFAAEMINEMSKQRK